MHKNNIHQADYDFEILTQNHEVLKPFLQEQHGKVSIDFSDPDAVKALNAALLKTHYKIKYWSIPDGYLCPPIPSRVEYIHQLADLLKTTTTEGPVTILDVGTGASCIYPLLGQAVFGWKFIGTDINKASLESARTNIKNNNLSAHIELRIQPQPDQILDSILKPDETITATMCNPPFFKDESEARKASERKLEGLGLREKENVRNFGGRASELWYRGGEKAFLHNYLYQSTHLKTRCQWFTSLVSKKENVASLNSSHKKLGGTNFKVLPIDIGNKRTRIVAWNFQ